MLENYILKSFITTRDLDRAKNFYCDILGLTLMDEDSFGMELDADGTTLRVSVVEQLAPQPFTVLGWIVMEIEEVINTMNEKGVAFKRFDGFEQDELGIWVAPDGTKVAWFNDPDGNILSLSE